LPKKLRVVTGWTLDLLFSRDLEQMLTMRDVEALTQMAGRVRRLVAQSSTTTSLAGRMSPPIVPLPFSLSPRMAAELSHSGFAPTHLQTGASGAFEKISDAFAIPQIELET